MKYATTPAALRSWQKLADTVPYYNSDYLACSTSDGYDLLATGKGAQWFMLTSFLLPQIASLYPENLDDLGVFGIPGDNPDDQGITLWIPNGLYGNKNSKNVALIKEFMKYFVSQDGLDAYCKGLGFVDGPLPADINYVPQQKTIPLVADINAYVKAGKTDTAMEFKTQVKGSNAQSICCECLSGQTTAKEAAEIYDKDCRKQAVQLGLNWN
jgi:raffinose/stachyose/melibiose transport system substrate-binding protein